MRERVSQRIKQGAGIPEASPGPELSLLQISAGLGTRVAVTGWHTLSAIAFKPLSPLRKQSQPGSRWPSGEVGRACIQSVLTELALRQLLESQLLSLNGQFYCILMEDVIIGWARLTENTFLSFLLLSSLSANCK